MIPDAFVIALLGLVGIIITGLIAAGVTIAIQLFKWKIENQKLWSWARSLQDHIYRGSPPPPPAAPPGLFD